MTCVAHFKPRTLRNISYAYPDDPATVGRIHKHCISLTTGSLGRLAANGLLFSRAKGTSTPILIRNAPSAEIGTLLRHSFHPSVIQSVRINTQRSPLSNNSKIDNEIPQNCISHAHRVGDISPKSSDKSESNSHRLMSLIHSLKSVF
jgi:hypothetical protein